MRSLGLTRATLSPRKGRKVPDLLHSQTVDDLFVGRRPVLDKSLSVDSYELVYRHQPGSDRAQSAAALARRVGHGDLGPLVSGRPVWLPAVAESLRDGSLDGADMAGLVLEVDQDVLDDPGMVDVLARWRAKGARIALREDPARPVGVGLPAVVDLVRIDARSAAPVDLTGRLRAVRSAGARVMAENVETHEQHRFLVEAGVDLFQGLFLTEPDQLQKTIPQNRISTLRLIVALDNDEVDIDEIERIVSQDVTLSYQLLRYVNSAFVGLRSKVSSIRQAVVLLGPNTVRQIAAVAIMSADDAKPAELTRTALVRAKLCEGLARSLKEPPSAYYTAGLFSALEALTDVSLTSVLDELPLTAEVRDGILDKTGSIGRAVRVAMAYERCDFDDPVFEFFEAEALSSSYVTAITWVDETLAALHD